MIIIQKINFDQFKLHVLLSIVPLGRLFKGKQPIEHRVDQVSRKSTCENDDRVFFT